MAHAIAVVGRNNWRRALAMALAVVRRRALSAAMAPHSPRHVCQPFALSPCALQRAAAEYRPPGGGRVYHSPGGCISPSRGLGWYITLQGGRGGGGGVSISRGWYITRLGDHPVTHETNYIANTVTVDNEFPTT